VDLKGKVAVVLVNDPDFEDTACAQGALRRQGMTYYGRWTYKYEEAARRAPPACWWCMNKPASYGWATVAGSNTGDTFDILRQHPAEAHAAGRLDHARCGAGAVQGVGLDFGRPRPARKLATSRPCRSPHAGSAYRAEVEVIHSKNVAAMIPGATRPQEA
jgi:hypothetical protein